MDQLEKDIAYCDRQIKRCYGILGGSLCAVFFSPLGTVGLAMGIAGLVVALGFGVTMMVSSIKHNANTKNHW